jgi:hypothetical protein
LRWLRCFFHHEDTKKHEGFRHGLINCGLQILDAENAESGFYDKSGDNLMLSVFRQIALPKGTPDGGRIKILS